MKVSPAAFLRTTLPLNLSDLAERACSRCADLVFADV
jgi:hypothetical protein